MNNHHPNRRRRQPPPHGDDRRYRYWQCRCHLCREATRLYYKRWREQRAPSRFVDPTGTIRRIQALVALGYGWAALGRHLDTTPEWPRDLARKGTGPRGILRRTADQIKTLSIRLAAQPEPTGRSAAYARTVAGRYGWHTFAVWDDIDDPTGQPCLDGPPDAEGDEVVAAQVLAGKVRFGQARAADQVEAYRQLAARGLTGNQIRHRLHINAAILAKLARAASEVADRQPADSEAAA